MEKFDPFDPKYEQGDELMYLCFPLKVLELFRFQIKEDQKSLDATSFRFTPL